jgi:hypothetical protein
MLTNNASFCWIPAVFKPYYTVMCLKHHLFFIIHPAVSYFYQPSSIVLRVVHQGCRFKFYAFDGAISLPLLCFVPVFFFFFFFEELSPLLASFVGLMAHSCNLFNFIHINVFIGLLFLMGEYYWHYFFVSSGSSWSNIVLSTSLFSWM